MAEQHQSKNFKFHGDRMPQESLRRRLRSFVFFPGLTLLVGSFFYVQAHGQTEASLPAERPASESTIADEDAEPLTLQSLLTQHRHVTGLSGITGLILHGSYIEDGAHYALDLSMRAPELVRKNVSADDIEITCCSDGTTGTLRVRRSQGETTFRDMRDDLYRYTLLLEGATMRLTGDWGQGHWDQGDWDYTLISKNEGDSGNWLIASNGPSEITLTHLIDPETGYELERSVEVRVDGQLNKLTLHLSDYRRIGNACLPYHYSLSVNGTLRGESKIDTIQLNPGLPSWLFTLKPEAGRIAE